MAASGEATGATSRIGPVPEPVAPAPEVFGVALIVLGGVAAFQSYINGRRTASFDFDGEWPWRREAREIRRFRPDAMLPSR